MVLVNDNLANEILDKGDINLDDLLFLRKIVKVRTIEELEKTNINLSSFFVENFVNDIMKDIVEDLKNGVIGI